MCKLKKHWYVKIKVPRSAPQRATSALPPLSCSRKLAILQGSSWRPRKYFLFKNMKTTLATLKAKDYLIFAFSFAFFELCFLKNNLKHKKKCVKYCLQKLLFGITVSFQWGRRSLLPSHLKTTVLERRSQRRERTKKKGMSHPRYLVHGQSSRRFLGTLKAQLSRFRSFALPRRAAASY